MVSQVSPTTEATWTNLRVERDVQSNPSYGVTLDNNKTTQIIYVHTILRDGSYILQCIKYQARL
jgi:hypothetical protein